tara:strand:+ start:1315 stop:2772 length:1458 start_codon:yes stop_codon:yes gene_type:complete
MESSQQTSILTVGFPDNTTTLLHDCLGAHYLVSNAKTVIDAHEYLLEQHVDLVLCMQGKTHEHDAIPMLKNLRTSNPDTIRVLGGDLSHSEMVAAINEAAIYQFFAADWPEEEIELLVRRALENRELAYRHRHLSRELKIAEDMLRRRNSILENELDESFRFDKLIFVSHSMSQLCKTARKAATTTLPVLIQGETGTGKELMARAIHYNSDRKDQPLLVQNCGGMSDELLLSELFGHKRGSFTGAVSDRLGLFPAANGGTVFLDEISEVSPSFQVSLLRFLQEGEVKPLGSDKTILADVRIIAASNRPLDKMVESKEFRRDLYYRLNGFQFTIPPLRERTNDIPVLAEYLAKRYGESINRCILGITDEVQEKLLAHDWLGNVRELENEIRRMVALAENNDYITIANLSPNLAKLSTRQKNNTATELKLDGDSLKEKVESLEVMLIEGALRKHRWNQSRAAKELGISRVGLANKIKRYELRDNDAA